MIFISYIIARTDCQNKNGEQEPFVYLAIGSLQRTMRIHRDAKIIVLLSSDALESTQLPFLSRFERSDFGKFKQCRLSNLLQCRYHKHGFVKF